MTEKKEKSVLKIGVAGAIAGSLEIVVTYPIEFAKTHLQLQHGAAKTTTGYTSALGCLSSTLRIHGVRGLYQGATPWFVFAGPRSAVRFATFESAKSGNFGGGSDFLCGLFAGSMEAGLCQTANQSIQIKLLHDASPAVAVKLYSHLSFPSACVAIAKHHGVASFFDGLFPAVLKGACTNAVRFFGYHALLSKFSTSGESNPMESLLAGGVAGAFSAVVSQPIDTVKANMMGLDSKRYASSMDCLRQIARADGPTALWNGVGPRTVRVFIEVGLQFALFEHFARKIDEIWPQY